MAAKQGNNFKVVVQSEDFNLAREYEHIREKSKGNGAIVTFTGIVRDFCSMANADLQQQISAIELEHYPSMTEKSLVEIINKAQTRWELGFTTIIHRIGVINADEQIVFVGTSSRHRKSAFEAAEFIMDYLKNDVPLWKREYKGDKALWVDAKDADRSALLRWE